MTVVFCEAASAVTVPSAGDFWNPQNWTGFVTAVGLPGFFALVFLAILVSAAWKMMGKWDRHLTRQERLMGAQVTLCRQVHDTGGVSNLTDFRAAGHVVGDVLQTLGDGIGKECGAAVKPHLDKLHETLRNAPAPLPLVQLDDSDR